MRKPLKLVVKHEFGVCVDVWIHGDKNLRSPSIAEVKAALLSHMLSICERITALSVLKQYPFDVAMTGRIP